MNRLFFRISLLTLLSPLLFLAQSGLDQQWHFGVGNGIDFSSGEPILVESGLLTSTSVEPASITDPFGNLLLYTDGDSIYNGSGETVVNGTFAMRAIENIFCPIPGDQTRFFLFRSAEELGVSWTIIDIEASNGVGAVVPEEKEQVFNEHTSQLMASTEGEFSFHWLIIANNTSGIGDTLSLTSYGISAAGLSTSSSYTSNYLFAGWNNSLEEARLSPNCDRIATSHKGHFITLFDFNPSTGEISTTFDSSAASPDSFASLNYLDFSSSGEYLYVLRDGTQLIRFNALAENPDDLLASESLIESFNEFSHIKRGPDGNMYLMDQNEALIHAIEDADSNAPLFVPNVLTLDSLGRFFPNTFSTCGLSLGIDESVFIEISVWPNPSQGSISIANMSAFEIQRIELFDALGRRLQQATPNPNPIIELDLNQSLQPGVYTLSIQLDQENSLTRKLIIR